MEGRDAIAMSGRSAIELRAYLRKADSAPEPEFDVFLEHADLIFRMRLEAEHHFKANPHIAKSKRQALPLDWVKIDQILRPDTASPPETLVTQIARECLNETEEIIHNMRKVLTREREKVSLGSVQQVDPHCLRWLSKQPGHNAMEKAGAKQRILAIIRRENFNTLENRVFKDFLTRVKQGTTLYLRENDKEPLREHKNIKQVKRLGRLCAEGLRNPLMEEIGAIQELPIPNYVLRQERRYLKIWKAYCDLIRQGNISERLWRWRQELSETLARLRDEIRIHRSQEAKYQCAIWFNYLDGKRSLLDKPFYKNALAKREKHGFLPFNEPRTRLPDASDAIIDLTGQQPCRDLLIYGCHENAKPYLQNYTQPSIEDIEGENHYFLRELLRQPDPADKSLRARLRDYFEQLRAYIGGERWFVLVPDNWDALWLEVIIKAVPLPRNNVFLLWRSVAAVIGVIGRLNKPCEDDTVAVVDIQQGGIVSISKLTLARGESGEDLIPQRKSFLRHKDCYDRMRLRQTKPVSRQDAFLCGKNTEYIMTGADMAQISNFVKGAKHVVLIDNIGVEIPYSSWVNEDGGLLQRGVGRFIAQRNEGKTTYYDELEALSIVVQTEDEKIFAKPLVQANEKSPGGKEIVTGTIQRAAILKRESDYVDLVLCMGVTSPDAKLKIKRHEFERHGIKIKLEEDHAIDLSARVTPGQGMAVVTVTADFLRKPIELDFLHGMTDKDKDNKSVTMSSLEDEMARSFPPDSPEVLSDDLLWSSIRNQVQSYMVSQLPPNGTWFAKAQKIYPEGIPLPQKAGPLERLRRKNVFGNAPRHRYPKTTRRPWDMGGQLFDFKALFQKLAEDYTRLKYRNQVMRLIAWTYASDEPAFDSIRQESVRHVSDYAQRKTAIAPLYQEMTICANLCVLPQEWLTCLKAIKYRIEDYSNNISRDFYLLYNLLQFHPTIIQDTGYYKNDSCWQIIKYIPYWYKRHRNSSTTIGYILKSILYFLRCRRFDGKKFLTKEYDLKHYEIISECLKYSVHPSHEKLRGTVIEYLNNKGTIDGLPVD